VLPTPANLLGIRDRSIGLTHFAVAGREHEIAYLRVRDFTETEHGMEVDSRVSKIAPRKVKVPFGSCTEQLPGAGMARLEGGGSPTRTALPTGPGIRAGTPSWTAASTRRPSATSSPGWARGRISDSGPPATHPAAGFRNLHAKTGTPAGAPKPTRPGPGRPLGSKNRRPATRYEVGRVLATGEAYADPRTTKRAQSPDAQNDHEFGSG
jgi:hypothetical protein